VSPTRRRSTRGGRRRSTRDFWGNDELVGVDEATLPRIRRSEHPTALVDSLGPLPFPGGQVAPHYFDLLYDRAASLALALAASAGLAALDDEDEFDEDDVDADFPSR
jgi:hypothetical protein